MDYFKANPLIVKTEIFHRFVVLVDKIKSINSICPTKIWDEIILPSFYLNWDPRRKPKPGGMRKNSLKKLKAAFIDSKLYKDAVAAGFKFLFSKKNPYL